MPATCGTHSLHVHPLEPVERHRGQLVDVAPIAGETGQRATTARQVASLGVVSARSAPKLLAAIADRDERASQRKQESVRTLGVLAALFTLNRRAKRCRDLAKEYYLAGMHGFAGRMRREKERIYCLKGQALHYLVEEGRLSVSGFHQFDGGNWAELLVGEGYGFHRPCADQEIEVPVRDDIEAKPKGAKEPTLAVAYEVVEQFLEAKPPVAVFQWPMRARTRYEFDEDFDACERVFDEE